MKQLERQVDLPEGSFDGDLDGDGQDGLTEFVMGSDPLDRQDISNIEPESITKNGQRYTVLKFTIRTNSLGLTAELQYSTDGRDWTAADDDFEVMERTSVGNGLSELCLISKEPVSGERGLFRMAIAR